MQKSAFTKPKKQKQNKKTPKPRRDKVFMPLNISPRMSTRLKINAWWKWNGQPRGKKLNQCESSGLILSENSSCPSMLVYFPVNLCSTLPNFLFKTYHLYLEMPLVPL